MKFEDIEMAERLVRRRKTTIRSAISILSSDTVQVSVQGGRGKLDVPVASILSALLDAARESIAEIDDDLVGLGVERPEAPNFAIGEAGELILPEAQDFAHVRLFAQAKSGA